jgi:DNA-binding Lrp family transcriptional regulator
VLETFENSVAALPRIQQCWRISGDTGYLLKWVARSVESMRQQLLHFAAVANVKNASFPVGSGFNAHNISAGKRTR